METKFTKGEWRAEGGYVKDSEDKPICQFFGASTYHAGEFEANAKLIAAAPELLKNLQYMVDAWEDVRISGAKDIMETFTGYAKDAIKKATE